MGPTFDSPWFWIAIAVIVLCAYLAMWDEHRKRQEAKQDRTQKQLDADWDNIEHIIGKKDKYAP